MVYKLQMKVIRYELMTVKAGKLILKRIHDALLST